MGDSYVLVNHSRSTRIRIIAIVSEPFFEFLAPGNRPHVTSHVDSCLYSLLSCVSLLSFPR